MLTTLAAAGTADAASLRAGVGRADVTPPTGYFAFGYVRSDAQLNGQHTRLFARAVVLERDGRKVALVGVDWGATPGGVLQEAAKRLKARGIREQDILVSSSHSHTAPTGFYPFGTYNFVAPTDSTPLTFRTQADPQLYGFMIERLTLAIARADESLAEARIGWGTESLTGITRNRSLEAHLANHGIIRDRGDGRTDEDPGGYEHTIDPRVDVLRIDRRVGPREAAATPRSPDRGESRSRSRSRRPPAFTGQVRGGRTWVPAGGWSTFANHGTVNPSNFTVYTADHHGAATRRFEEVVRRKGKVPPGRDVINAYGNGDEGDMTSGLTQRGPVHAEYVGRIEAAAMLRAWEQAGREMTSSPELDVRWTRTCMCGKPGRVADEALIGLGQLTGSEEERGPLFDETGQHYEDQRLPVESPGPHGFKIPGVPTPPADAPNAFSLMAIRIADRLVVSVPGEMTVEMGRRVRAAARAQAGPEIRRVVLSGHANEMISYLTTPEEYDRQHYEGAATFFGRESSNVIRDGLADLSARLADGRPAPDPYPFDPTNGLEPDLRPFGQGATSATALGQPSTTRRLDLARFRWQGGPRGLDRPLDEAFVTIERRTGDGWERATDDLGLDVLWRVDDEGRYTVVWQVARDAPTGDYRFTVSANRYRLSSATFRVAASRSLQAVPVDGSAGRRTVEVRYPSPERRGELIISWHPTRIAGGAVVFAVGDDRRRVVVEAKRGARFSVEAGPSERVEVVEARDRLGNGSADVPVVLDGG